MIYEQTTTFFYHSQKHEDQVEKREDVKSLSTIKGSEKHSIV
jgi:hypothetical protein